VIDIFPSGARALRRAGGREWLSALAALPPSIAVALAALAALPGRGVAQPAPPPSPPVDEMTVIGRYPGPPMWKVTAGAHSLWIFGSLSPLPKGLVWDSDNVERLIERSQTVIGPMRISAFTLNPFKVIGLIRQARRLSKNPDDAELADMLPPELYARYRALHERYTPRDKKSDEMRPTLAALRLYGAALDDAGLTNDEQVGDEIRRLARRSDAERSRPTVEADPEAVLDSLGEISPADEIECFGTVMASIETDLDAMKARANAWALGDVEALSRFDYPDAQGDCLAVLFTVGGFQKLRADLYAEWLREADAALAMHETAFATLPLRELFAADGLLAQLAAKGYTITRPSTVTNQ
jgi:uncharacterized protein YbaP (TraB family)